MSSGRLRGAKGTSIPSHAILRKETEEMKGKYNR
jgi:hypothetical protein